MNDREILEHLHWLYHERILCLWCRHPNHKPARRGLCSSCYKLAQDFRREPTNALAVAIAFAKDEGVINASDWPITGLEVEQLFERIAEMAFRWRKVTDNPFWHSANTWGESFSEPQRRWLFHHFSMVEREQERNARRARAWTVAMELAMEGKHQELREYVVKGETAAKALFGTDVERGASVHRSPHLSL